MIVCVFDSKKSFVLIPIVSFRDVPPSVNHGPRIDAPPRTMKARTLPGKSRFFIGFGALLVFGLFVLYHTSQQRVDDLRLSTVRCEQHEMAIRSQYELEMDKVGRLEKKLEASRVAEEKLQQKVRAEKDLREKASKDHNLRFSSLQQHYKLLQSEQDDAKTEFANAKEALENRLDVLTSEMGKSDKARLATIEEWKVSGGYYQLSSIL